MVDGVWQIKLPVPFPLGFVAVYLVEGDDGWSLIDAGSMRGVMEGWPVSAYEVSRRLFRGALTVHQRAFALAETLAHLDHLVLEGRARAREGAPVTYEAA